MRSRSTKVIVEPVPENSCWSKSTKAEKEMKIQHGHWSNGVLYVRLRLSFIFWHICWCIMYNTKNINVPCLMSMFLVSCPPSPVSWLYSLSPCLFVVLCPLYPVYPLSQCPLFCSSIPLSVSFAPLFPVFCSSISCPLSLVFHTCENSRFS